MSLPFLENGSNVPFSILKLPGAAQLIINNAPVEDLGVDSTDTWSDLEMSIPAYGHQQNASDKCLGVGPSKPGTGGLSQFKNISKAKVIMDERRAKKVEA